MCTVNGALGRSANGLISYSSRRSQALPLQPLLCLRKRPTIGHAASVDFASVLSWLLLVDRHRLELHLTGDRIDACGQIELRTDAHPLLDLLLQLIGQIGIVAQVAASVLAPLA